MASAASRLIAHATHTPSHSILSDVIYDFWSFVFSRLGVCLRSGRGCIAWFVFFPLVVLMVWSVCSSLLALVVPLVSLEVEAGACFYM